MKKYAVYSGSRNLYPDMVTAAKSLIANSTVDKVYFLIEDAEFPDQYTLPDIIETMDISKQKFFAKETCKNWKTPYTAMSLMRVCYTKLFPDISKILQLDVDTVVVDDIDWLWDGLDLNGKYFAANNEWEGTWKPYGPVYPNVGVAMFNLDQMRKDKLDEELIFFLNNTKVPYIDQDALARFAMHKFVDLPRCYNECHMVGFTAHPKIVHFAGIKNWQRGFRTPRVEYLQKYRDMDWNEVLDIYESNRNPFPS